MPGSDSSAIPSCPSQPEWTRARMLEAGKRWARLAQARAASRPGLCAIAPGRSAGAPLLWQLARSFPVTGPQPLSSLRRAGNRASTPERPQGSPASSSVWREDPGLLSRPCRKRRPSAGEDGGVSEVSSSCGARGGFLPRHDKDLREPRRGIASPVAIRRGEGAQRKRCRDPRCSPRGNPACRGTFGGRRKPVRDRLALQGGTGDFP